MNQWTPYQVAQGLSKGIGSVQLYKGRIQFFFMTQQQLLQDARNVLTRKTLFNRENLKNAAISTGRTNVQVSKASTMRLALWVTKKTSAI